MKKHSDASGAPILGAHAKLEPIWVAAALAMLTGRFRKKNMKPNPSAAAAAFGKALSRPSAVTDWVAKLALLECALQAAEHAHLKRKREREERQLAAVQCKEALARELTAVIRTLLREFDADARLDDAAKAIRGTDTAADRAWLNGVKFGRCWQTSDGVGHVLPAVSSLELCATPEFEHLAALLPALPSRRLVNLLYDANGSYGNGFKGFEPSRTWLAFLRARLNSSQLRQLRDGPFQEKDRFHALLCRVRDGGGVSGSDVDASIEAEAVMPSRESDSESTDH